MAHRRTLASREILTGDALTQAMVSIGMNFAAVPMGDTNIEDTLIAASIAGMEEDDLRVLSVLVTWLTVHHAWLNADRLYRAVREQTAPRVRAFWAAVGRWLQKDRRLVRLAQLHDGDRVDLLRTGTAFHIGRHGEDARFIGSPLLVPAGILRDRREDVMAPRDLAARHRGYRQRVQMGPTYRADMWAAMEGDPLLSPAELARRAYGSFATAWQVKRDFACLRDSSRLSP